MAQLVEEWTDPAELVVAPLVPIAGFVEIRAALQHANAAVSLARMEAADDSVASELDRLSLSKAQRLADGIWGSMERAGNPTLPQTTAFAEFLAQVVEVSTDPLERDEPAAGRAQLVALAAAGEAAWREVEDAETEPEEEIVPAPVVVTNQPPLVMATLGVLTIGITAGLAAIAALG